MQKKPARTFWARVKEALKDAGMHDVQETAARILDVTQPSVSEWNQPGGFPTIDRVVTLALRLNVCVEWLFTERGPKRPIPTDSTAQRIWDVWPLLDDTTKGELVGIATSRARPGGRADDSKSA